MKMLVADDEPAIQASIRGRITPHPAKASTDRLVMNNGGWTGLPRSCYRATKQAYTPSSDKVWGIATQPAWRLVDVPCDRTGMMTAPEAVTRAFSDLVV